MKSPNRQGENKKPSNLNDIPTLMQKLSADKSAFFSVLSPNQSFAMESVMRGHSNKLDSSACGQQRLQRLSEQAARVAKHLAKYADSSKVAASVLSIKKPVDMERVVDTATTVVLDKENSKPQQLNSKVLKHFEALDVGRSGYISYKDFSTTLTSAEIDHKPVDITVDAAYNLAKKIDTSSQGMIAYHNLNRLLPDVAREIKREKEFQTYQRLKKYEDQLISIGSEKQLTSNLHLEGATNGSAAVTSADNGSNTEHSDFQHVPALEIPDQARAVKLQSSVSPTMNSTAERKDRHLTGDFNEDHIEFLWKVFDHHDPVKRAKSSGLFAPSDAEHLISGAPLEHVKSEKRPVLPSESQFRSSVGSLIFDDSGNSMDNERLSRKDNYAVQFDRFRRAKRTIGNTNNLTTVPQFLRSDNVWGAISGRIAPDLESLEEEERGRSTGSPSERRRSLSEPAIGRATDPLSRRHMPQKANISNFKISEFGEPVVVPESIEDIARNDDKWSLQAMMNGTSSNASTSHENKDDLQSSDQISREITTNSLITQLSSTVHPSVFRPKDRVQVDHTLRSQPTRLGVLRHMLKQCDPSVSGVVSYADFHHAVVNKLGVNLTEEQVQDLFQANSIPASKTSLMSTNASNRYYLHESSAGDRVLPIEEFVYNVQNAAASRAEEPNLSLEAVRVMRKVVHAGHDTATDDKLKLFSDMAKLGQSRGYSDDLITELPVNKFREGLHYLGANLSDAEFQLLSHTVKPAFTENGQIDVKKALKMIYKDSNHVEKERSGYRHELITSYPRYSQSFQSQGVSLVLQPNIKDDKEAVEDLGKANRACNLRFAKMQEVFKAHKSDVLQAFKESAGGVPVSTSSSVDWGQLRNALGNKGVVLCDDDAKQLTRTIPSREKAVSLKDFCSSVGLVVSADPLKPDSLVVTDPPITTQRSAKLSRDAYHISENHVGYDAQYWCTGHSMKRVPIKDAYDAKNPSTFFEFKHSGACTSILPTPQSSLYTDSRYVANRSPQPLSQWAYRPKPDAPERSKSVGHRRAADLNISSISAFTTFANKERNTKGGNSFYSTASHDTEYGYRSQNKQTAQHMAHTIVGDAARDRKDHHSMVPSTATPAVDTTRVFNSEQSRPTSAPPRMRRSLAPPVKVVIADPVPTAAPSFARWAASPLNAYIEQKGQSNGYTGLRKTSLGNTPGSINSGRNVKALLQPDIQ